ncbi:CotH kinase family protein [Solibacillus sp. CAU 1738]|uniref:CotH kinase family protein n=1 Tax=Solibacillus sp. CAU 1738 TaxID=3140363 RepID=UPI0032606DC9
MERYYIEVPESALDSMMYDLWDHNYVNAKLKTATNKLSVKLALRGNQLREHKKKSYHIIFDKPFLFQGQHEIHLNAEYNDPSIIRNKLSFDFFKSIGVLAPASKHVLLYINGIFEGIYLILESFDQYYLQNHSLPKGTIYYATNNDANFSLYTPEKELKSSLEDGYTKKVDFQKDDSLKKLLIAINTFPQEKFRVEINTILDVQKYLKWLTGVVCVQNFDGFIHNYALYQNSDTGLFEITPWDYDGSWGRDLHGRYLEYDYIPIEGYNSLTARLLDCSYFKNLYGSILDEILQKQFTQQYLEPIIEEILQSIRPFIHKDPYLKHKEINLNEEKDFILRYIHERNNYLRNSLSSFMQ